jgi:alpha-ribazole phosphatase
MQNGNLFLLRHGPTQGDGVTRYKGSTDVPLSSDGIQQCQSTARHMLASAHKPDVIYCSPLSRAMVSAAQVAEPFALTPIVVPELVERNFGRWEGLSFAEVAAKYPHDFDAWAKDPLSFSPIEGESTLEVHDRIMPAVEKLLARHEGGSVAIMAHGGVNRVILCNYMKLSLEHIFRIEQDFACLNIIRFYDEFPVISLLNSTHY